MTHEELHMRLPESLDTHPNFSEKIPNDVECWYSCRWSQGWAATICMERWCPNWRSCYTAWFWCLQWGSVIFHRCPWHSIRLFIFLVFWEFCWREFKLLPGCKFLSEVYKKKGQHTVSTWLTKTLLWTELQIIEYCQMARNLTGLVGP